MLYMLFVVVIWSWGGYSVLNLLCPILGTDGGTGIQQVSSVCEVDCLRTMNAIIKKGTDRHTVVVVVQSAFRRGGVLIVSSTRPPFGATTAHSSGPFPDCRVWPQNSQKIVHSKLFDGQEGTKTSLNFVVNPYHVLHQSLTHVRERVRLVAVSLACLHTEAWKRNRSSGSSILRTGYQYEEWLSRSCVENVQWAL